MRLKRIEILGFKSFRDRAVLDFNGGINAIVGPNGCGKSNTVDAIRWVMGEQRVRLLRGKKMDDVIFNGSQDVAPVGMAEITMTFINDGVHFPAPYAECSEVTVSRRIFRDSESEYAINKTPCRLLDVKEFFMDTGIGVKTYSIVEQNSVAGLVEAKPEERRQFIEEAAGIAKYKSRKESAQRKMEATRENLTRLRDIIREVKSGLNALSRQVKRAEEYRNLRKQLREAEINCALQTYAALRERNVELHGEMERRGVEDFTLKTSLKTSEAAQDALKAEILEGETLFSNCRQKLYEIKNEINATEQGIEFAKRRVADISGRKQRDQREIEKRTERREAITQEITELTSKVQEAEDKVRDVRIAVEQSSAEVEEIRKAERILQQELEEKKITYIDVVTEKAKAKNDAKGLARMLEDITRRTERGDREIDEFTKRFDELKQTITRLNSTLATARASLSRIHERRDRISTELAQAKSEQKGVEVSISAIREELSRKSSRLLSLQEFRDGYAWCSETVKSIVSASRKGRDGRLSQNIFLGLVADHIDAPREYETAVEAVLGDKLQYIVVKNQEEGVEAINYLKHKSLGRGSFIPLHVRSLRDGSASASHPDEGERLRDVISVTSDFQEIADYLFRDVLLIPNLGRGIALWRKNGFVGTFVTPDGDIISPHGVLTGGSGMEREVSLLRIKREIGELTRETESLHGQLAEMTERSRRGQALISDAEEKLLHLKGKIHAAEIDITGIVKDLERSQGELTPCERRIRILEADREDFHGQTGEIRDKLEATGNTILSLEDRESEMNEIMTDRQEQRKVIAAGLKEREEHLTGEKVLLASLTERQSGGSKEREKLERDLNTITREIEAKKRDISALDHEIEESSRQIAGEHDRVKQLYTEMETIESVSAARRETLQRKENSLREREVELKALRKSLEKVNGELNEMGMEKRSIEIQIGNLAKNIRERFSAELEEFIADFQRLTTGQIEDMGQQIIKNRKALDDFGEVNLMATGEYEQIKERFDFLTAQEADLVASLDTLGKTITRINRITRKLFAETFAAVNDHFRAVYSRIFPGGKGELRLTDDTDMLETGVDIDVQIPGKRAQNVSLLSGGEKSLASIALIFAILLHRPSPFIVLDEVDAALDDANVSLFNDLLGDISSRSQIIVVTHNKKTMEAAETLLGVTMQKQGISSLVSVNLS